MIRDIFEGMASYGKAWHYVRSMRLWAYMFVPALISVVLGLGIGFTAWGLSDELGGLLTGWIGDWGGRTIDTIGRILSGLLLFAIGLAIFKVLVVILSAPFMSPLSEKIERHITGALSGGGIRPMQIARDLVRGIRINVRNLFRELGFSLLIVILAVFLPFLSPLAPVLVFLVQSYYAGFGNMDFALERHFGYRDSIRFVRENRGLALGNGVVYLLLLITGVGFLVALPLGTIAATLDAVERIRPGDVDSTLV